uniref:ABC transmembrane type-1 domain-containing protein n=1 Tax=Strongyloides papillosus TaxID=174720 RepID=A0A0N5CIW3_STREA
LESQPCKTIKEDLTQCNINFIYCDSKTVNNINNFGERKAIENNNDYKDLEGVNRVFSSLQVVTTCFGVFARGTNHVSNAIGLLVSIYSIRLERSFE